MFTNISHHRVFLCADLIKVHNTSRQHYKAV
jgi:hypothetical protein